ncbi:MAG: MlaC/ttg2D family ABC transporter substrate-binding protein [Stellaceae bacterium]
MSSVPRRAALIGLLSLTLLVPAVAPRAAVAPPSGPGHFINHLVNAALQVLAQHGLTAAQREQRFDQLLTQNFDVPRIARFVLGRYWRTASPAERQKFIDVYRSFIVVSYATRFSQYSGETVKVTHVRRETADISVVSSEIVHPNGEPPVKVSWRVRKGRNGYKIIDVGVEGVSMMLTQREEFASVIERNGGTVAGLTSAIEQKLHSGGAALGGG